MKKEHNRVNVSDLILWHLNPLKREKIPQKLIESIKAEGVLQPLAVVPKRNNKYLVIDGNRRLRVLQELGIESVDVLIYYGIDAVKLAIILNVFVGPWDQQTLGQLMADEPDAVDLIPGPFSGKLKKMQHLFGSEYKEFIENYTIAAFDWGMKLASYVGKKQDEEFCRKACLWVGENRMARRIRALIEWGIPPAEVHKAVENNLKLQVRAS